MKRVLLLLGSSGIPLAVNQREKEEEEEKKKREQKDPCCVWEREQ